MQTIDRYFTGCSTVETTPNVHMIRSEAYDWSSEVLI